jgi:O-antigen ligase
MERVALGPPFFHFWPHFMIAIAAFFAAVFATASWLIPNHYPPWASAHGEFLMAMALALAMLVELARGRHLRDEATPLVIVTLLLASVPVLQWLTGLISFAGDAWIAVAYLLGAVIAQVLGWRMAQRLGADRVLGLLATLLVTASVISVGIALYQWLGLDGLGVFAADLPPHGRPFANLAQPNHLATLLFLGLVGILALHENRRIGSWVAVVAGLFLEFGLVMTSSRTAWLAMALLVFGLCVARRRIELRISFLAIASIGVSFVVLLYSWRPMCDALLLSAGREFAEQAGAGPRVVLWQTALDAIFRRPWFGYGWNQILVAHAQVVVDHPVAGRVLMGSAHNLLLDLALWNGALIGLAVFAFLQYWLGLQAFRSKSATAVYLLIAILGVFTHALVEYPLSYAYFLFPVALMMGALNQHTRPQQRLSVSGRWAWGASVLAIALLTVAVAEYMQVEDNTRTLRFETARIGSGRIESAAPDLLLLTQWREYLRFARAEAKPGMSDTELNWMHQVAERFPYSTSQFRSALAHGLNGDPEEAAEELRRLCSMHTVRRCQEQLSAWHELATTKYPQLNGISMPSYPINH